MKLSFAGESELVSQFKEFLSINTFLDSFSVSIVETEEADFVLSRDSSGVLCLFDQVNTAWKPLRIDFESEEWAFRVGRTWNSKEILRQALGVKKGSILKVVDGTGGLLSDAFLMSEWGHEVHAFEASPLLAFMGAAALEKVAAGRPLSTLGEKRDIRLSPCHFEPELLRGKNVDVLYLDPMYPEKKKAALNSKEMRIVKKCTESLHHWTEYELAAVIRSSLAFVSKKVVLKRPVWAPELPQELKALLSHELKGKGTKFCVFQAGNLGR